MSFAKHAADMIASPESEQDAESKRSNWQKYLATALGLAGAGAAGYYGYKNWDKISPKIDSALGGDPAAGPGKIETATGNSVGAPAVGAVGGAALGEMSILGKRMPWHINAGGNTLSKIRALSSGAKDSDAPVAKVVQQADARVGGAGTLGTQISAAKGNKSHPLSQAIELGKGTGLRGLWNRVNPANTDVSHAVKGLGAVDKILAEGAPAGAPKIKPQGQITEKGPNGLRLKPGAKPMQIQEDPRVALARGIREGVPQHFGANTSHQSLKGHFEDIHGAARTKGGLLRRLLTNGAAGLGAGVLGEKAGL